MDDFFKSIKAILYDRVTSPFFGTLFISWLVWNWKIVYVTFFVSETILKENKIDYIVRISDSNWILIWFPLISTFALIVIVPMISNGAFWVSSWYEAERIKMKQNRDGKKLLSREQSFKLYLEIRGQEERFQTLLDSKNAELEKAVAERDLIFKDLKEAESLIDELSDKEELTETKREEIEKESINKLLENPAKIREKLKESEDRERNATY